ncbi:MAG: hypothetical protein AAGF67_07385 [Verrucomicrobiota bacterium]
MSDEPANPFLDDVFLDHPESLPGAPAIHHSTFHSIVDSVEALAASSERKTSPADTIGRILLVTAPRAGYGKTHLAARLRRHLRSSTSLLELSLDPSRPVSWPVAFSSILRQYVNEPGRRAPEITLFAETGHFLLSQLILSHRNSGALKSDQCPVEDDRLRSEFFHLFGEESDLLTWTDQQSRELSRRADSNFLHSLGLSAHELGFWTRLVIDYTLRGESALDPLRGLSPGEARERMLQWLRISAFYGPNLVLVDGLDGFFESPKAGMEIAGLLTGIREFVPRTITLLTLNEDIWKSVFENRLPSAWLDRITGESEKLRPISPEAAADLVKNRLARTAISEIQGERFIENLRTEHLWIDSETKLYPRAVIHQARTLWNERAARFLSPEEENSESSEDGGQEPLSKITDKVAFFEALAEDRLPPGPEAVPEESPAGDGLQTGEDLFPREPAEPSPALPPAPETDPAIGNPFFAPPAEERHGSLVGIESIIRDIRGSGTTVVSESADTPLEEPLNPTPPSIPSITAGDIKLQPAAPKPEPPEVEIPDGFAAVTDPKPMSPPPEKATDWVHLLKTREAGIQQNSYLKLDHEKVEVFLRKIGTHHPGLSQREERYPSSRTVCLRWNVRGESVLIGFESPQNVYFWNNLLQQSLASNRREKLAAFSHRTESFDPGLFSSFGFSPSVIEGKIDVIEMKDRELAMIYAADSVLEDARMTEHSLGVTQIVIRYLDPLWRRISRTLPS